jgi:glycosyltransferase involved in cell wall biosynthesis
MFQKKINVLHFAKIISRNDFVDSIVSNLDPILFDVHVAVFKDASLTLTPLYKEKNIIGYNLNEPNARNIIKILPFLSGIIKDQKINIVHAHLFEEQFIAAILKVWHPKVKFVIGRHYSDEIYLLHSGIKRKVWITLENLANKKVDAIIAGSKMVKEILLKQNIKSEKIALIPYGFDFDDHRYQNNTPDQTLALRNQYQIKNEDLLFVNVGRLFKLKGQNLLIDVFFELKKKHKNIKLLIVGDGDQRTLLEAKVSEKGLQETVIFTGWLKDAHTLIAAADVIVHPTLSEMFSQFMIESMALAKPIIINNVSGVRDVITNNETGIICAHKFRDWFQSIELLINNKDLRLEIGKRAEEHVKKTYPINKIIKQYQQLYTDL